MSIWKKSKAPLHERLLTALQGDAAGVLAGDLLLCRESVLSGEAARDRDVLLEVRDQDRYGDCDPIEGVGVPWIREEGAFCALHGGCSLGQPGEPRL